MDFKRISTFNMDLSENVAYNEPDFPAYTQDALLSFYPGYAASPHWHEDFEFLYVRSGSMTYNVNGVLTDIEKGECIFVNSRRIHYGFSRDKTECDFICVLIHPSVLSGNKAFYEKDIAPVLENDSPDFLLLNGSDILHAKIIAAVLNIFQSQNSDRFRFAVMENFCRIAELLPLAIDGKTPPVSINSSAISTLKTMLLFIQNNFDEKISLADISKAGLCSKSKCSALFSEYINTSPIAYLNDYRLKKSCELLTNTDMPVTEIVYECGFAGESYFCECFKKKYKTTPLKFRKQYRND